VGHLDTNGVWLGNVELKVDGLWAEYFTNLSLAGLPVLTNTEPGAIQYTNAWPEPPVTAGAFSVRWSGILQPQVQGDHAFYVRAGAGAAFRLSVNGAVVIDHWTSPATNVVELAGTNWLATNILYGVKLEYAYSGASNAEVRLSWRPPGSAVSEVIPRERFGPFTDGYSNPNRTFSDGPTGVSVDAAGKIWAVCMY
jgi:hypothetical protein